MTILVKVRTVLVLAAITLTVVLLLIPSTRELLLFQCRQIFVSDRNSHVWSPSYESVADAHPDDMQIQIADAQNVYNGYAGGYSSYASRNVLTSLESKFPSDPSVYANILRWLTVEGPKDSRPESNLAFGERPPSTNGAADATFPYEFYDNAAVSGEKLDPKNAYFPLMRSIGLFGQHRDAEALAEIHRAAQDTTWKEYYQDEVLGNWTISDIRGRNIRTLDHVIASLGTQFPQYARFRDIARIALYKAMLTQRSGHTAQGISIRQDLMQCGSLMRSQSTSVIGSLVGIAICSISTKNPKGINSENSETRSNLRSGYSAYCTFLKQNGYSELIPCVQQEYMYDEQVRHVAERGPELGLDAFSRLYNILAVGVALLAAIFALLVIAGIASLALVCFQFKNKLCLAAMCAIAVLTVVLYRVLYFGIDEIRSFSIVDTISDSHMATWIGLTFFISLIAPIVCIKIISAVISLKHRKPLLQGVLTGLSKAVVPAACLLFIIHGVILWKAVQIEQVVNTQTVQRLQSEGALDAKLLGEAWPGPTKWVELPN